MGASFRNIGQIQALAGCDRLTISPELLKELDGTDADLSQALKDTGAKAEPPKEKLTEAKFRWGHNEDAMATDKLAEGIRKFAVDQRKLEELLGAKL
jgi:transaldolase